MGFWKNIANELEYQNISRKELAQKADFAVSGISLGISNNSVPSADVAVRIAKVLGVSVEYLVTGKDSAQEKPLSPQLNRLFSNLQKIDSYDAQSVNLLVERILNKNASSAE